MPANRSSSTFTYVSSVHRWVAVALLALAAATAVYATVDAVISVVSGEATLGFWQWLYLLGRLVLLAVWTVWAVALVRGATATIEVGEGALALRSPFEASEVTGVTDVTVRSWWAWHWVKVTGSGKRRRDRDVQPTT